MGAGLHTGTRRRGALRTVATDAAVVASGVATYFGVRGLTAGDAEVAREHARDILRIEKELGLDVEAGVQSVLVDIDLLTTLANWVYIWGHWPVIAVTMVWLALRDRRIFLRLRNAMIASGLMGLCVYTTYPVAPPRLAGMGFVDTITEQSQSYRVLQPPAFVNQYAAMPSLHVGWDLLVGLALVAAASSLALRTVGRLMPVVMGAATVLTANHYVLDILVGAAFGLAGWAVALVLERRREARAAAAVPGTAPAVSVPVPRAALEACEQHRP
jgi:membrane-associated phospholipid phosphatase